MLCNSAGTLFVVFMFKLYTGSVMFVRAGLFLVMCFFVCMQAHFVVFRARFLVVCIDLYVGVMLSIWGGTCFFCVRLSCMLVLCCVLCGHGYCCVYV